MQHQCKVTVLATKCFGEYQRLYLADPHSGPCTCFHENDAYLFERTAERDDFYHMEQNTLVGEAADPEETAGSPARPFCSEA